MQSSTRYLIYAVVGFKCSFAYADSSPPLFIPLDPLAGYAYCIPRAISGDASTVVGASSNFPRQAFVWTAQAGTQSLGWLPGTDQSEAYAVSADGTVIVGTSGRYEPEPEFLAFRWSKAEGMQALAPLPDAWDTQARGISADGQVVAGTSFLYPDGEPMGFRWTAATGTTAVGSLTPNPPFTSRINGISDNGVVLVGESDINEDFQRAIRWTTTSGMQSIYNSVDILPSGRAASGNGSIIVLNAGNALRWTAASGAQPIPQMRVAYSVSADGTIVVGAGLPFSTLVANIWTQPCGTRVLRDLLLHSGFSAVRDWELNIAYDIADDNRTIVGMATNPTGQQHGFLARLPKAGDVTFDGVVDINDLLESISHWGPQQPGQNPFLDINCDNVVNVTDLLSMIANWG